jgi:hypothetical protein
MKGLDEKLMDINAITNKRISHATLRPTPKEAGP